MNNIPITDTRLNLLDLKIFLRDNVYQNLILMDKLVSLISSTANDLGLVNNCYYNIDSRSIILDFGKSKSVTMKQMMYETYINQIFKVFLTSTDVVEYIQSLKSYTTIADAYNLILLDDQYTPNIVRLLYDTTIIHNYITIYL